MTSNRVRRDIAVGITDAQLLAARSRLNKVADAIADAKRDYNHDAMAKALVEYRSVITELEAIAWRITDVLSGRYTA